ncbi:MAG: hypothetical protein IPG50_07405 [Myxococcales bacterium]|nr:hypothetical protein [Myxococcales bacterium]
MPLLRATSLLLGVALALGVSGCDQLRELAHKNDKKKDSPPATVVVPADATKALPFSPRARRQAIAAAYRLRVDRRFVMAAAEIARLLGAPPPGPEVWTGLADLPDYPELAQKLMAFARTMPLATLGLDASPAPSRADARPLYDDAAHRALAQAQAAWGRGEKSRANLASTAHALASLAFQVDDRVGVADGLFAQAIALHVVADIASAGIGDTDRMLVAAALGYTKAAAGYAAALPKGDGFGAFLAIDDVSLRQAARGADAITRLLWLRRVGEARGAETPAGLARLAFPGADILRLPPLGARLDGAGLEDGQLMELGPLVALAHLGEAVGAGAAQAALRPLVDLARDPALPGVRAAAALAAARKAIGVKPGEELAKFDALAAKLVAPGPLVPVGAIDAYYRAHFFSRIDDVLGRELDLRSDEKEARARFDALKPGSAPSSRDLRDWLSLRVHVLEKGLGGPVVQGAAAFPALGQPARAKIFAEISSRADWGSGDVPRAARLLAATLDSRPSHRRSGATAAYSAMDLAESDRLLASSLSVAPFAAPEIDAWKLARSRDVDEVRRTMADARFSAPRRARVLAAALRRTPNDPVLLASVEPLVSELPRSIGLRTSLAEALLAVGRPAEGRALLFPWMNEHDDGSLRAARARRVVAESFRAEGELAEAKIAAQAAAASGQFDAVLTAARIDVETGAPAQAVERAKWLVSRYPGSKSGSALALIKFLTGDPRGAVAAMQAHRVSYVDTRWKIAHEMVPVLVKGPAAEIDRTIAALGTLSDPISGMAFVAELRRAKRPDLAFSLTTLFRPPGLVQLEIHMDAFEAKRDGEGEPAALAWLDKVVPPPMRPPLSMFAFGHNAPAVLWTLVPPAAGDDNHSAFDWLMRAATVVQHGGKENPHYGEVIAYFTRAKPSPYAAMGRALMGLGRDEDVEPFIVDEKRACEAAFYMAHKADYEGRAADAIAYYRVSLEAGSARDGEYRWSFNRLDALRRQRGFDE